MRAVRHHARRREDPERARRHGRGQPLAALTGEPEAAPAAPRGIPWADRGWYLAIDYGVLSKRANFTRAHARLRTLGDYKELLDEEGRIVHRNLFRENGLKDAWTALAMLQPWRTRVQMVLCGEDVAYGQVHDLLWCAAFESEARTCLPRVDQETWTIGCDRVLDLGPRDFDRREPDRRHLFSFARLHADGKLHIDADDVRAFVASGKKFELCPAAPVGILDRLVAALPAAIAPETLGWGGVLELDADCREALGTALAAEHELDLLPRVDFPRLGTPITIERGRKRKPAADGSGRVQVVGPEGKVLADRVLAPEALFTLVTEGKIKLHAAITGGFYRRMRFMLKTSIALPGGEKIPRPASRRGWEPSVAPQPTADYGRFVRKLLEKATRAS